MDLDPSDLIPDADSEVSGRYPSDDEWADTLQRAEDVKREHDSLFRRLAGRDA